MARRAFFPVEGVVSLGGCHVFTQVDTGAVTSSLNARNVFVAKTNTGPMPLSVSFAMVHRRNGEEKEREFCNIPGRYYKRNEVIVAIPAVICDLTPIPYEIQLYTKLRDRSFSIYDLSIGLDVFIQLKSQYNTKPLLRVTNSAGLINFTESGEKRDYSLNEYIEKR